MAMFRLWAELQREDGGLAAAVELMQNAGVPLNQPEYGVPAARRIQKWLNAQLGGAQHVRLVLLKRERGWRVAWKSGTTAAFTLVICCASKHWSYLAIPQQLFNAMGWCPDCESTVGRRTHPGGCRVVCPMCYRWGLGYPCVRQPGQPSERCGDCGFIFPNPDCLAAHKQRVDPVPAGWAMDRRRGRPHRPLCEERHLCGQCGAVVWLLGPAAAPHQCPPHFQGVMGGGGVQQQQQQQCVRCRGVHNERQPCFIQPRQYAKQFQWGNNNNNNNNNDVVIMDGSSSEEEEEEEEIPVVDDEQQPRRRRQKPIRFVFWDVETEQISDDEEDAAPAVQQQQQLNVQRQHIPLLVCADVVCERCIAYGVNVDREPLRRAPGCFCGVPWQPGRGIRRRWCLPADPQLVPAGQMPADGLNPRRMAFHQFRLDTVTGLPVEEQSAMSQFVEFLTRHGRRLCRTIGLAHNGGRYDIVLLLEELQRRGVRPKKLVSTGLRIYQLKMGGHNERDLVMKDSLNFFNCALGSLPATFGLVDVEDKPFFPYAFIRKANLHTVLDHLPPLECYEVDGMKPAKRDQCVQWYTQEPAVQRWVLCEKLVEYCSNDCRLLRVGSIQFRHLIGEHAQGIEPFQAASTIAGLALANFLQQHHHPNRVLHSPEGGYLRGRRASAESLRFFWVLEREMGVQVQTAQWSVGEHQLAVEDCGLRVDGLIQRPAPQRPLAIEYMGCFFHGCRQCYPDRLMSLAGKQTAEQLYGRTQQRIWELEHVHGYEVRQIWGCEWKAMLRRDRRLRMLATTAARHHLPGPLDLRKHAYFGGRVEPFALKHVCTPNEEICVLDIVSLYPTMMKYRPYPLGHPDVLTAEELGGRAPPLPWTRPEENPFTGFLLCRVLPPRGQGHPEDAADADWFLPLLPMRTVNGRLVFPLCRQCAERQQQTPCGHCDMDRSWIAGYTHFELNRGLQLGYTVTEVFEVWHYKEWSVPGPAAQTGPNGLFSSYVDQWLQLKVEASGWPAGCDTQEQRDHYVEQWWLREGIRIRPDHVELNPGLRHLAKLLLNAMYGKLAQRPEGEEVHYTETPRQFHDLLGDRRLDVMDFLHLNDHLDRVQTRKRPPFAKAPATNAMQLAAFVTSYSRVFLYDYFVDIRQGGGRLLYGDTDSAVHARQRDAPPCVPEGDWLGQMKREMPSRHIQEFWCAGPKNYVLRHRANNNEAEPLRADIKCRGIELTHEARQELTFRRIRRLIQHHFGGEHPLRQRRRIGVPQRRFVRTREAKIFTRRQRKLYKPVYTKGVVLGNGRFETRPFGWIVAEQVGQQQEDQLPEVETESDESSGDEGGDLLDLF